MDYLKNHSARDITTLLPKKSAIFPLIIAPSIAPIVHIEPNTEYCNKNSIKKGLEITQTPTVYVETEKKRHKGT